MKLIGVTGGIGSGKSMVCRICALRGFPVYDCDSRAQAIMQTSSTIQAALREAVSPDVIHSDGTVNRPLLASAIFSSRSVRDRVNAVVHAAVREDILACAATVDADVFIVESAILHTSGLDEIVDEIWLVEAPEDLRVHRVMARSGLTAEQIKARIEAQDKEYAALPAGKTIHIVNDDSRSLLTTIPLLENNHKIQDNA